jgi:hypothetical protein
MFLAVFPIIQEKMKFHQQKVIGADRSRYEQVNIDNTAE